QFRRDRLTHLLLLLLRPHLLPTLALDTAVQVCKCLAHIFRMRNRILAIGKSRGALLDLQGASLAVFQQTMRTAGVLKPRLAARAEQSRAKYDADRSAQI